MTRAFSIDQRMTPRPRTSFRPDAEGLEGRQLLTAGALDTTFNSTGYVLAGPVSAQAVQIQPLTAIFWQPARFIPPAPEGISGWSP